MKKLLIIACIIFWAHYVQAYTYTITQLTNDNYIRKIPQINDSCDITWSGSDGQDYEIFFYNDMNNTITQLTMNNYKDTNPQINNGGNVVWAGSPGSSYAVFFYDKQQNFSKQITDVDNINYTYSLNNKNDIAWPGFCSDTHSIEIYLYTEETITLITSNDFWDDEQILNDNGDITWIGQDDIFLYKNTNKDTMQLTNSTYNKRHVKINNNGDIVWCSEIEGGWYEIFFYNAINDEIKQITDDFFIYPVNPQLNNNQNIVWHNVNDYQIYFYDDKKLIQITNTDESNYDPQINESGDVVWVGNGNDVLLYDRTNEAIIRVTDPNSTDSYSAPQINKNKEIVFLGKDEGFGRNIFFAKPMDYDSQSFKPNIGLSLSTVELQENYSDNRKVLITNNGAIKLKITDIYMTGINADQFKISSECDWLSLGANCHISINFSPTSSGTKEATLVITSNDPDKPTVSVALIGVGAEEENNFPDDYIDGNSTDEEGNINNENHTPDNSSSENNNNPGNDGCFITSIAKN